MTTNPLTQPLTSLSGIRADNLSRLQKLGLWRVQDLLFHLPLRYEDRTQLSPMNTLRSGLSALICGQICAAHLLPKGRNNLVCILSDGSAEVTLRFYHYHAKQLATMQQGAWLCAFGEVRHGYYGLEMIHPDYRLIDNPSHAVIDKQLLAVYPSTEGLSQVTLRKLVQRALTLAAQPSNLIDYLPADFIKPLSLPTLLTALNTLHAPELTLSEQQLQSHRAKATERLALEELLTHHVRLRHARQQMQTESAPVFQPNATPTAQFYKALPFTLTQAQRRVMAEIAADCAQSKPMLRLLQGDVGSGKTVVAAYAALLAVAAGYQVAIMSPTELLAEQHQRNFTAWFAGFDSQLVYLTGSVKGKPRQRALQAIAQGKANIVIGTHALFQEAVQFYKLGLIIIDEQHRFGVHQRLALRDKAQQYGLRPHSLVMTATPIPRTLAMLSYADLDLSLIDELPPHRQSVHTSVLPAQRRAEVVAKIAQWVAQGKQVYWVCTLISQSERLQAEAALQSAEQLIAALPQVRIGLVHGKLKASAKEAVMNAFKAGQLDLLVATTVIEVGVDVPNANLMVIENPERLGLAQLHQLRGRVGRGASRSYCLLLYQAPLSAIAAQRLGILRDSHDGFFIAEKDLQLRGGGELLGTKQTGQTRFKVADLRRDSHLLPHLQTLSEQLLTRCPEALAALSLRWLSHFSNYTEGMRF